MLLGLGAERFCFGGECCDEVEEGESRLASEFGRSGGFWGVGWDEKDGVAERVLGCWESMTEFGLWSG